MTSTHISNVRIPVARTVALTALLALAVAVSPRQAYADHGANTAAAVLVGAALLYAAHEARDRDRKHVRYRGHGYDHRQHSHRHHEHCGHHYWHRDEKHHRNGHGYSGRRDGHFRHGAHHRQHAHRYQRDGDGRSNGHGRDEHRGGHGHRRAQWHVNEKMRRHF